MSGQLSTRRYDVIVFGDTCGVDVTPEGFVEAVREHRPDFVGMSALLTTMPGMGTTVKALKEAGLRGQGKVRARSSQLSRSR
jgi:5-methyltetrahydrofolate--homocysteine methyltransferase